MITIRIRSAVWFVTGLVFALVLAATWAAWRADAAPGDTDATFNPITPCRLFDYRPAPDTVGPRTSPLGPGEVATQQVTGAVGNCNVPAEATGVAMNVTIVGPTAQSNLRLWNSDAPEPLVSNLNWLPGQSPTPNKVDVKLSPTGEIKMKNLNGNVFVLADVVGYYTPTSLKTLVADIAALEAKLPIAASARTDNVTEPADASSDFIALSVEIVVPGPGLLQIVGGVFIAAGGSDGTHECDLTIGSGVTDNNGSPLEETDRREFVPSTVLGACTTNGAIAVDAGTHTVNLVVQGPAADSNFDDANLDVLFVSGENEVAVQALAFSSPAEEG